MPSAAEVRAACKSDRLTPPRLRAAVGRPDVDDATPVDPVTAGVVWLADLLLGVHPDHPEGAVGCARWAAGAVAAAVAGRPAVLAVTDSLAAAATGCPGSYSLPDASPSAARVTADEWFRITTYNLAVLVDSRTREVQSCRTPPSGPTPGSPPPPSSCSPPTGTAGSTTGPSS